MGIQSELYHSLRRALSIRFPFPFPHFSRVAFRVCVHIWLVIIQAAVCLIDRPCSTPAFSVKQCRTVPHPTRTSLELFPLGITEVLWTVNGTFRTKTQPPKVYISIAIPILVFAYFHLLCSVPLSHVCFACFLSDRCCRKQQNSWQLWGCLFIHFSSILTLSPPCPCICIKVVTDEDPIVYSYIHRLGKKLYNIIKYILKIIYNKIF